MARPRSGETSPTKRGVNAGVSVEASIALMVSLTSFAFPRLKPSALAQALLAATDRVTAYDGLWFAGRPST